MMNHSDVDWALHQIEQMVILARRSTRDQKPSKDPAYLLMPTREVESLEFSLGDILDKVTALKDELLIDERATAKQGATGSDAQPSDPTDGPESAWERAYSDIEDPIRDAV